MACRAGTEVVNKKMNSTSWDGHSKHLIVWTYDGTTVTARADGVAKTVSNYDANFTKSSDQMGYSYQYSNADLAAILIYNTVLSGTDIANVESYLNAKYPCY